MKQRFSWLQFSNHDSKSIKEKEKQEKTQNQGNNALERVRAQNIAINNNLYDVCNECTYDACSNAQNLVQFFNIYQ